MSLASQIASLASRIATEFNAIRTEMSSLGGGTPDPHAASHASGGSDAVTLAQSQVTNLTTDLAGKANLSGATFTGGVKVNGRTRVIANGETSAVIEFQSSDAALDYIYKANGGGLVYQGDSHSFQGASSFNAGVSSTGEVNATLGAYAQFRAKNGTFPAFMIRNDGNNTYFLLTANGDPDGSWNSFRPLTISNSTGATTTISPAATGTRGLRNQTISTANPSGGSDGDVWLKYTP